MRALAVLLALAVAAPAWAQPADDAPPPADDRATWAPTARGVRLLGGYAFVAPSGQGVSASVAPQIGAFVRDGLAVSLQLGLGAYRYTGETSDPADPLGTLEVRTRGASAVLGPAVTYYVGRTGAGLYPFVGVAAQGGVVRSSSVVDPGGVRTSGAFMDVSGLVRTGLMVPIARNVALETQATLNLYRPERGQVDVSVGVSAGIATFLY